jgi:hypothetical protein
MHRTILWIGFSLIGLFCDCDSATVQIPVVSHRFELAYGSQSVQKLTVSPLTLQGRPAPEYVASGLYTVSFLVTNTLDVYPGYYEVRVDFGPQELCEGSGWGTQFHAQVTLVCPGPGYLVIANELPTPDHPCSAPPACPAVGAQNFVLTFTGAGWPVKFDNLSFSFTPKFEPTTGYY